MAKLSRVTQKLFGSAAGGSERGVFGSLAAGSAATTTNVATMMSLSNWLGGWFSAITGSNSPAIEDMNAFCYVMCYQIFYLLEQGIPEYDSGTTYYQYSIVMSNGGLYVSLVDTNLGNALTDTTKWAMQGNTYRSLDADTTLTINDQYVRATVTADRIFTLPPLASTPDGTKITLKNVMNNNGFTATLKGNGAELIDFANTIVLENTAVCESATVIKTSTKWELV